MKKYLILAAFLTALTPSVFGLTLEQSKQFREQDYILNDGITIEYKGKDKALFFVDKGQPYHYSRIQQEEDGDLFRWVELRETKQEKYIKYVAKPKRPIPEIIVRGGFPSPFSGKTAPDTICDLVYDRQTGKPKNVYLVDFETQIFEPVLKQAVRDLREELGIPITTKQAVLFFYNRCSSEHFPFEQVKREESEHQQLLAISQEPEEARPEKEIELTTRISPLNYENDNKEKLTLEKSTAKDKTQHPDSSILKETEYCPEINNRIYRIADDARRQERLASFVSQLEFVHSWDWEAESFAKLISLINIAYPVFVHYEDLGDDLKKRYDWIIEKTYNISDEIYKQLPCQKKQALNAIFEKVLGKIK